MKTKPAVNKRKRIIFYYSLGLLLPGIVLGFLAFRGLQNDQALREKQNRQELQLFALDFWDQLDGRINELRKELMEPASEKNDLVLISWQKPPNGLPKISQSQMIFWPDGSLDQLDQEHGNSQLEKAQRSEFSEKNYPKSIRQYQDILNQPDLPSLKIQALLGLGRVYKKSDQLDQAFQTYQVLAENHLGEQLSDHLPVGAIALEEEIRLSIMTNDSLSAKMASEKLLRFFIDPPVQYEQSQFDYLYHTWIALHGETKPELHDQLQKNISKTEELLLWNNMSAGFFSGNPEGVKHLESSSSPGLFIQSDQPNGEQYGWVLNLNLLVERSFPELFTQLDPEGNILWSLEQDFDNSIEINFPSGYPPWTLHLKKKQVSGWKNLFETSQGVLILVFAFIMILMIAGLAFMLHTLNQEMKLNKLKSNFISNVSHEFKTPLTSIRHMTEIMHLKRIDSEDRKEEYLQSMLEQCDHLGHLIENILDFSKIEEDIKNYRFENHQLDEILIDLVPVFKGRIPEADFQLTLDIENVPPPLLLDKDAIQQVVYNLLDNAYKYSGGSKRINLKLSYKDRRPKTEGLRPKTEGLRPKTEDLNLDEGGRIKDIGGAVLVSVRDYGIGILEKDLGRIFERFYRGDRLRTEGIKGSGIGLTIVNRIVKAHGGRIEVQSEINKGTIFTVTLPVKAIAI